jgi:8-oxo-dGTP pyrophosphatase MutT (NUDIX family)
MIESVGGFYLKNGKIPIKKDGDIWRLIGGRPLPEETPEQCLIRRAREQTGATVQVVSFYNSFTGRTPHGNREIKIRVYQVVFTSEITVSDVDWTNDLETFRMSDITKQVLRSLKYAGIL